MCLPRARALGEKYMATCYDAGYRNFEKAEKARALVTTVFTRRSRVSAVPRVNICSSSYPRR